MEISEKQQEIINTAIELLKKYDKEEVSDWIYYFVMGEDDYTEKWILLGTIRKSMKKSPDFVSGKGIPENFYPGAEGG